MNFTIKKADGKERKVAGYKFSAAKLGSSKVASSKYQESQLPKKVDLRPFMTSIENQGGLNSCVANAVAGAYEYLAKRHNDTEYDVSRLFIYYNARALGNMENQDEGAYIADAIESLKQYGACSEETYPYKENMVNEQPDDDAYAEAEAFLVESVERVEMDINAWKSALAEGYPIIFGVLLFESFDNHRKKGLVPMPSDKDTGRESHGGHAMLCVGYSDPDQVFIVRNSWGNSWGDNGYCYIPYRYLINENFNMGDSWTIKQLDHFEDTQDYWSDEEESILSTVESEIANMSDDDYAQMCEDMGDFPLEQRLAFILLWAAQSDEEFTDEEYDEIATYLEDTLYAIGIEDVDVDELLRNTEEYLGDEQPLEETVELLNHYLSKTTLAQTIIDVENIIGVDEYAEDEANFVDYLIECWQIEDEHFEEANAQFGEEEE